MQLGSQEPAVYTEIALLGKVVRLSKSGWLSCCETGAIQGEGIVFTPAVLGVRLFLWAFGYRDADERFLLDPRVECAIEGVPKLVEYSGLVYKPDGSGDKAGR